MKRKKVQRVTAGVLAAVMLSTSGLSGFSVDSLAQLENLGKTDKLWSSTWHYYCIDHIGIAANGFGADNDVYQCFSPSAGLSSSETALIFWATLCMQAGFGNQNEINNIFKKINDGAVAAGLRKLEYVTQDDLGRLLHVSSVRAKYAWLDAVVANADKYLQLAGLLGGSGGGAISGVPEVLSSHTSEQNPYSVDGNTMTIPFDASGKDKDFIRTVPLKFYDGSGWSTQIPTGWSVEKKDTEIVFHSSDPTAKNLKIWFDTAGTQYGLGAGGQYSSPEDVYENSLELWLCTECSGTHKYVAGGNVSLDMHQRCVFLTLPETGQASFYAAIGTVPSTEEQKGSLDFKIYRHEEDWETNYNVQFYKYDHETGKTLEGSIFNLYERFDDQDQIADHDGYGLIYRGGEDPYLSYHKDDPVTWDGFRFVSSIHTDGEGHGEQTINHAYHYEKTFCDGHPEPSLVEVPEEETDENGEISNQDEIDAAEEENENLQAAWQECVDACEAYAEQYPGVHFHWLGGSGEDGDDDGEGSSSASGEEAFEKSCIWYFREVIDLVGRDKMQEELKNLQYGNCDISEWNGSNINPLENLNGFWLDSSLKISPLEQVEVLSRIFEGHSDYDSRNIEILKRIMLVDENDSQKIYGKTGSGNGEAWFVGFSESDGERKYIAIYLNDSEHRDQISGNKAKEMALEILK